MENNLKDLVWLSNELGKPENNLVIIGEGNTSCVSDSKSFFVKSSGSCMIDIKEDQFVKVYFDTLLSLLEMPHPDRDTIAKVYTESKVHKNDSLRPSVEALFHAVCLSYKDVNFVGHTHPTAIIKLACSKSYPGNLQGRMYPDEIVVLGTDSVFLPYVDPGVVLAVRIKKEIDIFISKYGEPPKAMYMQNHGFIALGKTAKEVMNITLTAQKAAEVRFGALLTGGVFLLDNKVVNEIAERPDEKFRKELFIK